MKISPVSKLSFDYNIKDIPWRLVISENFAIDSPSLLKRRFKKIPTSIRNLTTLLSATKGAQQSGQPK